MAGVRISTAVRTTLSAALVAVAIAGCGGSAPSHSSLVSKLHATLLSNPGNFSIPISLPASMVGCMTTRAGALTSDDLTKINGKFKIASQPTRRQFAELLSSCLDPATTKRLEQTFSSTLKVPGVPKLESCYRTQLTGISQARFGAFLLATIGGTPAQKGAAQTQLAGSISTVCLQSPAVLGEIRQLFATGARAGAAKAHAPQAYTNCVLRVAGTLTPAQAAPLLSPATSQQASKQLTQGCKSLLS
jgi:hypothetical protein